MSTAEELTRALRELDQVRAQRDEAEQALDDCLHGTTLTPLSRLDRDVKKASVDVGRNTARHLVNSYYTWQEHRIALAGQVRSLKASGEPTDVLEYFLAQVQTLERQLRSVLDGYSTSTCVGEWSRAQKGIGPVIAAGLMAHIDITRAPTVGHIYSFAGVNPNAPKWGKGEKRPYNADLKIFALEDG